MDMVKRKALNQALAKAIAFKDHGNPKESAKWAGKLISLVSIEFLGEEGQRATVAPSDAATG